MHACAHMHARTLACTCTDTHTCTLPHLNTLTYTHRHTNIPAHANAHRPVCTFARVRTRARNYTCAHTHSVSDKCLRQRVTGSLDCCAPRSAGVCVCAGEVVVTAGRVHGWTTLDGGILTRGVPGMSTHLKPNPAVAPRRLHPDQMTGSHIDKNTRPVSNPPPPPLSHSFTAQKSCSYCLMLDSCLLFNSFTGVLVIY